MLLKEICDFKNGKSVKITADGDYPIIGSASPLGLTSGFNIDSPVVCIGRVGSVGALQYINQKCWATDNVIVGYPNEGYNARYLYYLLGSMHLENFKIGTTQPLLTIGILDNLEFEPKSVCMQQHIVDTIGSVDDLIEKYDEIDEKILSLCNAIFRRETEGKEEIDFGCIPYVKIIKSGIKKFDGTKIYLDTSSVQGIDVVEDSYIITYGKRPSRANMQPISNSIWFAKMKNSPKYMIVKDQSKFLLNDCIFSTGFAGIESSKEIINYLYIFMLSDSFKQQLNSNANGSTMQAINNDNIAKIKIPNLTQDEASKLGKELEPLVDTIIKNQNSKRLLKQAKETLLHKYFD